MKSVRRMLLVIALVVGVALVGCGRIAPVEPARDVDALAASAVEGVSFLPPLGAAVELSGDFDPDVNLHIEVFNLATGASIEGFSVGGDDISVTFEPGVEEQYYVNWHTRTAGLPDGTIVRIEVRLSHAPVAAPACDVGANLLRGCLAYHDVQLLRNLRRGGGGSKNGLTSVVNGQTLPIKVHLREGVANNSFVGPHGGVVIGADGVILRAEAGELAGTSSVAITGTDAPDVALPSFVTALGVPYELVPTNLDDPTAEDWVGLFAEREGFLLGLPVPDGADESRLAVAVLNEPGMIMGSLGHEWEFLEGQFDPESRLLLVRLYYAPPDGITFRLVTAPDFVTRTAVVGLPDETGPGVGQLSIPSDSMWLTHFTVRPINGRPAASDLVSAAFVQALEEMIPAFRNASFPSFRIRTDAEHVCPGGRITSRVVPCYWDYSDAAYIVYLGGYTTVSSATTACQEDKNWTINGTASPNGTVTACTRGTLRDGRVVDKEANTLRHELMHSVQFRFPRLATWRHLFRQAGDWKWLLEGTAVLSERTLVEPDFHLTYARAEHRDLRRVDIPLRAGPPNHSKERFYQVQDFWAFTALKLFNFTDGDGISGFGHLMKFFERGVTPAAVNQTLREEFSLGATALADLYWSWAKNQAFERQVDLGDGSFLAMGTCSPSEWMEWELVGGTGSWIKINGAAKKIDLTASVSGPVFETLTIEPLTSRWVEVDISALAAARVEIAPEAGSTAIRAKLYRDRSVDGWRDCAASTREAPSDFEYVSWSQLIEGQPQEPVYVLVANTDFSRARSVTVTVTAEGGAPPLVDIGGDDPGSGFDDPTLDEIYDVLMAGLDTSEGTLRLSERTSTFPFIWIALSARGTIAKIDTGTGEVLGEYRTAPQGIGTNPSRTTVGLDGSVWAGNRNSGHVVHVGLREAGQCVDRNGDGVITTSSGYGDALAWPTGADPVDECILHLVDHVGADARHVSVNADGDIWVGSYGGTNRRIFQLIDAMSGSIIRTEGPFACGGYGGLIDRDGVLWSATSSAGGVLRWDPYAPMVAGENPRCLNVSNYGLAVDSSGWIWVSSYSGNAVRKISPDGWQVLGPFTHGSSYAQGLAVDDRGHVWVSSSLNCYSNCAVGHLLNDGTFVGRVPADAGSTGVAVDAEGKVWTANINASTATRIDPSSGPLGADGMTPVGAVDLTVPLPGANPYNYSDMTGRIARTITTIQGTWNATIDSEISGYEWQRVVWQLKEDLPAGTGVDVKVRAADERVALGALLYTEVVNDADLSGIVGRFLQIEVKLFTEVEGESPEITNIQLF